MGSWPFMQDMFVTTALMDDMLVANVLKELSNDTEQAQSKKSGKKRSRLDAVPSKTMTLVSP